MPGTHVKSLSLFQSNYVDRGTCASHSNVFWHRDIKRLLIDKFDYWLLDVDAAAMFAAQSPRNCLFPSELDLSWDLRQHVPMFPLFVRMTLTTGLFVVDDHFKSIKAGQVLGSVAQPFTVDMFQPTCNAIVNSLSVNSDLCTAIFERIAYDHRKYREVAAAIRDLGKRVISVSASVSDFVSVRVEDYCCSCCCLLFCLKR